MILASGARGPVFDCWTGPVFSTIMSAFLRFRFYGTDSTLLGQAAILTATWNTEVTLL